MGEKSHKINDGLEAFSGPKSGVMGLIAARPRSEEGGRGRAAPSTRLVCLTGVVVSEKRLRRREGYT